MKRIVIDFSPNGNTQVEAFGFQGSECLSATKSIEEAIGKTGSKKDKPEMALRQAVTVKT
jgi:transketolase N-terminal domain/subunit